MIFGNKNVTTTDAKWGLAVGYNNSLGAKSAYIFGNRNSVSGKNSFALGYWNIVAGANAYSFGKGNHIPVSGEYSDALGRNNIVEGANAVACGNTNNISSDAGGGLAFGKNNVVQGYTAASFGYSNSAIGNNSLAFGKNNYISQEGGLAFGYGNETHAYKSSCIGSNNTEFGSESISIGMNITNYDDNVISMGVTNDCKLVGRLSSITGTKNNQDFFTFNNDGSFNSLNNEGNNIVNWDNQGNFTVTGTGVTGSAGDPNGITMDVTNTIRVLFNNMTSFQVTNSTFGNDPDNGQLKICTIVYIDADQYQHTVTFSENDFVYFGSFSPKAVSIVSATWGVPIVGNQEQVNNDIFRLNQNGNFQFASLKSGNPLFRCDPYMRYSNPIMGIDVFQVDLDGSTSNSNADGISLYSLDKTGVSNWYNPINGQSIFTIDGSGNSSRVTIADANSGATQIQLNNDLLGGAYFKGKIGIGTTQIGSYKLAVEGNIRARKVKIDQQSWPDYVFDSAYKLQPLENIEQYIKANKHLPDVPAAADIAKEGGLDVGDNQALLMKKVEELTLYMIDQQKKIEQLEKKIEKLEKK